MDAARLEKLKNLSYEQLDAELANDGSPTLIDLLDSDSIRIGDTAASLLSRRNEVNAVVDAILSGKFRRRNGKIRAMWVLNLQGKSCPRALDAYLTLVRDKNAEVVDQALFGVVFMQAEVMEQLKEAMSQVPKDSERHELYTRAIDAIQKKDPFMYSPGFSDHANIWGLRDRKQSKE
jgi:hypothetical protein